MTSDFGGVQMAVTDGAQFGGGDPFNTTSGSNVLGTDDADLLQSEDDFALTFGPTHAIGMFFISTDALGVNLLDSDIVLGAGGESAELDTSAIEQTLLDGSNVFFLGIVDPMATFTSANVSSTCCGFFLFISTTSPRLPCRSHRLQHCWVARWPVGSVLASGAAAERGQSLRIPPAPRVVTAVLDPSAPWGERWKGVRRLPCCTSAVFWK